MPAVGGDALVRTHHTPVRRLGEYEIARSMRLEAYCEMLTGIGANRQKVEAFSALHHQHDIVRLRRVGAHGACLPLTLHAIIVEALACSSKELCINLLKRLRSLCARVVADETQAFGASGRDQNDACRDYERTAERLLVCYERVLNTRDPTGALHETTSQHANEVIRRTISWLRLSTAISVSLDHPSADAATCVENELRLCRSKIDPPLAYLDRKSVDTWCDAVGLRIPWYSCTGPCEDGTYHVAQVPKTGATLNESAALPMPGGILMDVGGEHSMPILFGPERASDTSDASTPTPGVAPAVPGRDRTAAADSLFRQHTAAPAHHDHDAAAAAAANLEEVRADHSELIRDLLQQADAAAADGRGQAAPVSAPAVPAVVAVAPAVRGPWTNGPPAADGRHWSSYESELEALHCGIAAEKRAAAAEAERDEYRRELELLKGRRSSADDMEGLRAQVRRANAAVEAAELTAARAVAAERAATTQAASKRATAAEAAALAAAQEEVGGLKQEVAHLRGSGREAEKRAELAEKRAAAAEAERDESRRELALLNHRQSSAAHDVEQLRAQVRRANKAAGEAKEAEVTKAHSVRQQREAHETYKREEAERKRADAHATERLAAKLAAETRRAELAEKEAASAEARAASAEKQLAELPPENHFRAIGDPTARAGPSRASASDGSANLRPVDLIDVRSLEAEVKARVEAGGCDAIRQMRAEAKEVDAKGLSPARQLLMTALAVILTEGPDGFGPNREIRQEERGGKMLGILLDEYARSVGGIYRFRAREYLAEFSANTWGGAAADDDDDSSDELGAINDATDRQT